MYSTGSNSITTSNLIVARTFFASGVPHELEEAAEIDGCSTAGIFFKIVLPLSKAMLGVIMLYYLVAHWNNFSTALYYTPQSTDYWPLQKQEALDALEALLLRDVY